MFFFHAEISKGVSNLDIYRIHLWFVDVTIVSCCVYNDLCKKKSPTPRSFTKTAHLIWYHSSDNQGLELASCQPHIMEMKVERMLKYRPCDNPGQISSLFWKSGQVPNSESENKPKYTSQVLNSESKNKPKYTGPTATTWVIHKPTTCPQKIMICWCN